MKKINKKIFFIPEILTIGLVMLLFVHLTTPYLNHPLGIGIFIFWLWSINNFDDLTNETKKIP